MGQFLGKCYYEENTFHKSHLIVQLAKEEVNVFSDVQFVPATVSS